MKGQPVDQLVFEHMFPKPKPTEPQNFHAFLQRSLIPEVRQETHAFYGHLDTQEAKYPGLDYAHPTHRLRLGRWPWHRRLFRAFDNLGLTPAEIAALTKWEGTRWAKEKYETEQGIHIRDTAGDGLPDWVEPMTLDESPGMLQRQPRSLLRQQQQYQQLERELQRQQDLLRGHEEQRQHNQRVGQYLQQQRQRQQQQQPQQQQQQQQHQQLLPQQRDPDTAILRHRLDSDENMDSDDELESVGVELNNRLRAQAARREAGEASVVLDEEWEQWLKTAIEAGVLTERMSAVMERSLAARMTESLTEAMTESMTDSMTEGMMDSMSMTEGSRIPASLISHGMLNLARAGRWSGIPENLHPALQRALDTERASIPDGHDSHERPQTSATRSTLQPAEPPRDRDRERDIQRERERDRERDRNMDSRIARTRPSGATPRMAWSRGPYTPLADAVAAVADIL